MSQAVATPVVPPLRPSQRQAVDFIVSHPYAGIWLGLGGGKTMATLAALTRIRPAGHILVIAPIAIARSVWIDEIAERRLDIRTRSLIVDENDRKLSKKARLARFQEVFTDPPTMYFINQDLISRPASSRCTVCKGLGGHRGRRPCPACQTGLVDQMPIRTVNGTDTIMWPFPTVVIDESQGFKSHSSRRFKALARVRPAISRLIELSGTPAPNGLTDLWSQMYLLDQGEHLGRNITAFRNRWFTARMVPGKTIPGHWDPNPGAEEEIHQAVRPIVMSARNVNLRLPELTVEDNRVSLSPQVLEGYRKLRSDLVLDIIVPAARARLSDLFDDWLVSSDPGARALAARLAAAGGSRSDEELASARQEWIEEHLTPEMLATVVAQNKAVLASKLLQYASGTLYTADPDDPDTAGRYEVIHQAKIEMAEYLIRNNGGSPVLLAHHFRSDATELMDRLAVDGFAPRRFDGSRAMVCDWNARRIPVMLIHPASGGPGLNLQYGGHTLIWYTLPFSLEHYQQMNARLHRPGQADPVTIHRLIARGTTDERMPAVLAGKTDIQDALLDDVARLLPGAAPRQPADH
ncbi:DEAD/DEAH box helicase [Acidipropionibacterium jensenii]|uniref:DEAD/DEAH box helicase n=1 Tax=Acidipropionibacterium jensenii TaxID=1749 RepID=UPI00214BCAE0|nr:DEAD/DEAH box helicase [Acidipropionibacterium jensenii]